MGSRVIAAREVRHLFLLVVTVPDSRHVVRRAAAGPFILGIGCRTGLHVGSEADDAASFTGTLCNDGLKDLVHGTGGTGPDGLGGFLGTVEEGLLSSNGITANCVPTTGSPFTKSVFVI